MMDEEILTVLAQKRKRSQNFTLGEKEKLVKLLMRYKEIILNRKTDSATNIAKHQAWTEVTNEFNAASPSSINRSRQSLMKFWDKIKGESKLYYENIKKNSQTDGGTTTNDPILEMVCLILGRCTAIQKEQDNDTIEINPEVCSNVPAVKCTYEIESVSLDMDDELNDSGSAEENENKPTESASIRQKDTIEDLKIELLREELEFKRKLYKLQLQVAAKDVEIKTEMLKQIKGKEIYCLDSSEQ